MSSADTSPTALLLDPLEALTPREREVLALMAEGRTNPAIAAALFIGVGAVEKNVTSIFSKQALSGVRAMSRSTVTSTRPDDRNTGICTIACRLLYPFAFGCAM